MNHFLAVSHTFHKHVAAWALALGLVVGASASHPNFVVLDETFTWTNTAPSGVWQDANAWAIMGCPGCPGFPGLDNHVYFTNALAYTVALTNNVAAVQSIDFNNAPNTLATVTLDLGTHVLADSSVFNVADAANSTTTVYIDPPSNSGGGLVVTNGSTNAQVIVGLNGIGALFVTNGHVTANTTILGNGAGSRGTVVLSGPNTVFTNTGDFAIGNANTSFGNSLVISNGGAMFNGTSEIGLYGISNSVLVAGSGSVWSNQSNLYVGKNGPANSMVISNGGTVFNFYCYMGYNAGSSGNRVLVTDNGSEWNYSGILYVGSAGQNNSLVITNGGNATGVAAYIGFGPTGDSNRALVTGSGSVWSNSGSLVIGGANLGTGGSYNSLVVSGGGKVVDEGGNVGLDSTANNNSILVTDSGSVWSNSAVLIGSSGQNNSLVISNGGAVVVTDGSCIGYVTGSNTNRVLVTGNGSVWNNSTLLSVGGCGQNNSLVINNGGAVVASDLVVSSYAGSSNNTVTLNSGSLIVTNSDQSGSLEVRRGALTMNSPDTSVGVDRFLATNGANSVVTFNGGALITKSTTVSNGVVFTVGNGANSATLTLASGGTGFHSFNNGLAISSNATLNGIGTVTGNATIAGTLSPGFSPGTLTFSNNLVLSSSSVLQYELGTNSDLTVVSGNLTLGGTLNVTDAGGFTHGTYTLFSYGGALTYNGLAIGAVPNTNFAYTVNTNIAGQVTLTVIAKPVILTQPVDQTAFSSQLVNFSVTASGAQTYQWYRNGSNLKNGDGVSGANTSTLTLTDVSPSDAGIYTVVVSDAAGSVTSSYAVLRVWTPSSVVGWGQNDYGQATPPAGLSNAVAVAGGYLHSLAIKSDGRVVAWGDNNLGQTNVPPGLTNAVAVAGGYWYSLGLKSNGAVVAWGNNSYGQTNVPPGLTNAVAISAGLLHCLALKSDGTVVAWGGNFSGERNVPSSLTNAIAIAGGGYFSLALKSDGTVAAWGTNGYGQISVPADVTNATAIASGWYHSLALKSDGTVVAWGWNNYGQTNVPPGLTNVVAIACGGYHSLAFKSDGTVVAWGLDNSGQTDVPAGLTNAVAIAGGGVHSLALGNLLPLIITQPTDQTVYAGQNASFTVVASNAQSYQWRKNGSNLTNGSGVSSANTSTLTLTNVHPQDAGIYTVVVSDGACSVTSSYAVLRVWTPDSVVAWGMNTSGQASVPTGLTNAVAVASGYLHSLALKGDGTVVAWGLNSSGEANVPSGLTNAVAIASGGYHNLVLKRDGTLVAWGLDSSGQTDIPAGLTNVVAIASGGYHNLVLKRDGTVVAWGLNSSGQASVPSGLTNVVAIACGYLHSLALKGDGTVVAWGLNSSGEANVPSGLMNVVAIAGGGYHSLALKSDGTAVAWGYDYSGQADVPSGLAGVMAISSGYYHNLALKSGGTVAAWGFDYSGQADVPAGLTNVVAIACGGYHNLAIGDLPLVITTQPTDQNVYTSQNASFTVVASNAQSYQWRKNGSNLSNGGGVSGANTSTLTLTNVHPQNAGIYTVVVSDSAYSVTSSYAVLRVWTPSSVVGWGRNDYGQATRPAGLSNVVAVAGGAFHDLALKGDGTVVAWGQDWFGQTNVPSGLTNVVAVAGGAYHSLALKADGTVVVWGTNNYGQADVPPGLTNAVAIAAGADHNLALKSDGTVVAWGSNNCGQTNVPPGLTNAVAVAGGFLHSLALKSDGTVVAWGYNHDGQTDVPPGLTNAVAIAGGVYHSLALKADGTVVVWGLDNYGQTDVPPGLTNVVAIAAGERHSLALKADGTVVAWGYNNYGQTNVPPGLTNVVAIAAGDWHSLALGNLPPVASFSGTPTSDVAPLAVTFTDTSTGNITNRFWNFGDGNTANTMATSVSHTFGAGIYTVSLTVSGPWGSNTSTLTNYIAALTPAHLVLSLSPANCNFGTVAVGQSSNQLFCLVMNTGQQTLTGSASAGSPFAITGGSPFSVPGGGTIPITASFNPVAAGSFTGAVIVASNGGNATNAVRGVGAIVPSASFTGSPTNGPAPLAVTFTDTSIGTITNRFWDFGDGATTNTTGTGSSHTYGSAGTYTVNLTVSGPVGISTSTQTNYIVAITPAHLVVSPANLNYGTVVVGQSSNQTFLVINTGQQTLTGSASVGGPFAITGGSPYSVPGNGTNTVTVGFSPVAAGTFSNAVFFASHGGSSTNMVGGMGAAVPNASFTGNPTTGPSPLTVAFTDTSAGTITNRFWDFGDGATTNTAATGIFHTYNVAGTNTVTLIVSGPAGASTNAQPDYIVALTPPRGQLYVANWDAGTIGKYAISGATVNTALVSRLSRPYGVALGENGNLFVAQQGSNTIGEYTTSGATVNASLISGLHTPLGLAADGYGNLYVVNNANGTIGKYTTSGATVNASLVSGLNYPLSIALDGNGNLFVLSAGSGTIGEYTTSGATVNASLITGLNGAWGIAVDGNSNLFVSGGSKIGKYTTSGATVNASLVTGLNAPLGLVLDGYGNLFVSSALNGTIGEYTTSGATVNPALISGLNGGPTFMAIQMPGPSSPPVASFAGSPTNGVAPLAVTFTDASTGWITNWFWDFGDGNTTNTTDTSLGHTYNAAGIYTVSLIVSGPGGSDTNTLSDYVVALAPAHLVVTPDTLDYGSVVIGQTNSLNFYVINTGDVSLSGTAILADAGPFAITSPPGGGYTVDGGQTQTVTVAFVPSSGDAFSNSVIFASNGGDSTNGVTGAGVCTYELSAPGETFGTPGGSGSFIVNTPGLCAWTLGTANGWIHPSGTGSGTGPVNYTVDGNASTDPRSGTISVQDQTFTVTQAGCTYALSSSSAAFPTGGGTNTVNVITTSPCPWNATPSDAWLTILSGVSGAGAGSVTYVVDPNTVNCAPRTGTLTIAGQTFTVNQAAGSGSYVLSAASADVAARPGGATVRVTAGNGCSWTATANQSWLHTNSRGTGNGTVSYRADSNTRNCAERTGTLTIAGQTFTVNQAAGSGRYGLSAGSANVAASTGSGSVDVTAGTGCSWTAVSSTNWLHTTSGGMGNGTVSYTVDANTGNCVARTGTLTIAGRTFTVNQASGSGSYTLSAVSADVAASAGSGSVGVTAGNGCKWEAISSTNWLHTSSSGMGNGTASYTVDANTVNCVGRTGTLTIAGQTFTVNQAAGSGSYALSASSANVAASTGSGSVGVAAGAGCSWTAISSTNWLHTSSSGTGNGTVSYTVDANTGNCLARTGTLTIAGRTFTVNQAAGSGSYALSASSADVAASAGGGSVDVTAGDGCSWTTVSSTNWLHTSSSGTGNGTVSYTVDANTGNCVSRTGTLTVAGQTFTVNQAAGSGSYTLSSASANVAASGGSGSVGVTAGNGCTWTATANQSWLHTSSSGTGNGTVSYTVDGNAGTDPRSGTITVQGQTFTVTQAGNNTVPSLLVVLTASGVSTGQVNLSWNGGGLGVASYRVFRGETQIATTNGASCSDNGLTAGTEYCYTVAAYDSGSNMLAQSAEVCTRTLVTPGSLLGTYNGLIIQTNAPSHASSGAIKLVLNKKGSFTAKLTMGGAKAKFKGLFDASGNATNTVTRKGLDPLQVILHLDVAYGTDQITGTVLGGVTSELLADRAVYNRTNSCPLAGSYTVVLEPPDGSDPDIPQGYGYGTLTITTIGGGKLKGMLADGTKVTCKAPVSRHGTWPLYEALYKKQGSCIGWVTFATNSTLEATVDWFRPAMPTSDYYPAGFATNVTLIGEKYVSPSAGGPSPAGARWIIFGGGDLVSNIVQAVSIDAAGNVTGGNLNMKLQLATGLFSGSFTNPALDKAIDFNGAVLQLDNSGAGYFLGTNESGSVTFAPTPP